MRIQRRGWRFRQCAGDRCFAEMALEQPYAPNIKFRCIWVVLALSDEVNIGFWVRARAVIAMLRLVLRMVV